MTDAGDPKAVMLRTALIGGAGLTTAFTVLTLLFDPTSGMNRQLDAIEPRLGRAVALETGRAARTDVSRMAQMPIFIMTTGAGAYKGKSLQLFGLSVSTKRKAALVAIDGAPAVWMSVDELNGDVRLVDVGTNGASFETPIGSQTVSLSDPSPAAAAERPVPAQ
jgi:hypothetical protein